MQKKRILISGAGLAGLALYQILDRDRFDVDLIEKYEGFANLGYAVIFMPNGVRALRTLGYSAKDIQNLGKPVRELRTFNREGKVIAISRLAPLAKKYDDYLLVRRQDLHSLLESRIPKGAVRFTTEIVSLQETTDKVRIRFEGERKTNAYDLVVGADGIHSGVRAFIFPDVRPVSRNVWVVWTWLSRSAVRLNKNIVAFDSGEYGFGFFDINGQKKVSGFLFATKKVLPERLQREAYPAVWADLSQTFKSKLLPKKLSPRAKDMYAHEDRVLSLRKWSKGKVVLIGDAAHAKSVFTGAGTALALEDAVVLGTLLNDGAEPERAIRSFERVQKPRVRKMVHAVGEEFVQILDRFLASSPLLRTRHRS